MIEELKEFSMGFMGDQEVIVWVGLKSGEIKGVKIKVLTSVHREVHFCDLDNVQKIAQTWPWKWSDTNENNGRSDEVQE